MPSVDSSAHSWRVHSPQTWGQVSARQALIPISSSWGTPCFFDFAPELTEELLKKYCLFEILFFSSFFPMFFKIYWYMSNLKRFEKWLWSLDLFEKLCYMQGWFNTGNFGQLILQTGDFSTHMLLELLLRSLYKLQKCWRPRKRRVKKSLLCEKS